MTRHQKKDRAQVRRFRAGSVCAAAAMTAVVFPAAPAAYAATVACDTTDLINAIITANSGGDNVLNLTSYCLYSLTVDQGSENGLPPITASNVIVHGNNATIERAPGSPNFRIFNVAGGGGLHLDNLAVVGGSTTTDGGGILVQSGGALTTDTVTVQGNRTTRHGGGISVDNGGSAGLTDGRVNDNSSGSEGGGVDAEGDVTLLRVTVDGNRGLGGGGINTDPGAQTLSITDSVVKNNVGREFSGGIDLDAGNTTISGTRIVDNETPHVAFAGGIFSGSASTLQITGSTISGNTAASSSKGFAGGLDSEGTTTVIDTDITDNKLITPQGTGAGIFQNSGTLTLDHVNVTGNLASGRYSVGGGIFSRTATALDISNSHIDRNKVTGTGSFAAGMYNDTTPVSLTDSTVNNNTAPLAPAPGGIWTNVQFTLSGTNTFTGNIPTNCLLSPVIVTGCVN
ncbi:right-handed parallel beta-helix repeat-containing protein [Streptomyces sp. NPDC047022]|uniref:right-handed parallel beta-helix repeat-containing protein n=1 Tax=Streptomyces sp. NPDC047022 TaxID=3155737 RepID=UPI0033C0D4D8